MPLLTAAIKVYWFIILLRVISSWVPPEHRPQELYAFLLRLTEPVLAPVRKVLPPTHGLDLSPLIVLLLLSVIVGALRGM